MKNLLYVGILLTIISCYDGPTFEASTNQVCIGEQVLLKWDSKNENYSFKVKPQTRYTKKIMETLNFINSTPGLKGKLTYAFSPEESIEITFSDGLGIIKKEIKLANISKKQIEFNHECREGTSTQVPIGVDWTKTQPSDILISVENLSDRRIAFGTYSGNDINNIQIPLGVLEPGDTINVAPLRVALNSKFFGFVLDKKNNEFCNIDGTIPSGNTFPPTTKLILEHACPHTKLKQKLQQGL